MRVPRRLTRAGGCSAPRGCSIHASGAAKGIGRVGERRPTARRGLARLVWFPPAATSNRVEARLALAPPTPPGMRVRTGRFAQHSRKRR